MSERVWNKVNSPKLEKILPPLKRTTKKSELKPLKEKEKKKVDPFILYDFSRYFLYQTKESHLNLILMILIYFKIIINKIIKQTILSSPKHKHNISIFHGCLLK